MDQFMPGGFPFVAELETVERVIAFIAARHRLSAVEAEDFGSHVMLRLVESDYAVLRKFEGRSSLRTYLTVVIQRLFLDYRVAQWGKWRPSAEAKRAGKVGIVLEQLLSRDGYSFEQACEIILTRHRPTVARAELERIAAVLPSRPTRKLEDATALADYPDNAPSVAFLAERTDRRAFAKRVSTTLKRLTAQADPQDRLMLALRFEDGRTVAEIASMLQLDPKRLYRRFEHVLRTLKDGLRAEGIVASEVLALMDDPALTVEWMDRGRETRTERPSMTKGANS